MTQELKEQVVISIINEVISCTKKEQGQSMMYNTYVVKVANMNDLSNVKNNQSYNYMMKGKRLLKKKG